DDATIGAGAVAVVSDAFWSRQFGRDPSLVGRTVRLNGVSITIVGIARPGFSGVTVGESIDVWLPVAMQHELHYQGNASINNADERKPWLPQDGIEWLSIVARIPPAAASGAPARIDASYRRHLQETVAGIQDPARRAYRLREHATLLAGVRGLSPLRDTMSGALVVLMSTVVLLLLVACANLANLLLARTSTRAQEFAIRSALGAGRGRLVAQSLTESLILSLFAGAFGVVLAQWSGRLLLRLASPGSSPIPLDLPVDWHLLTFALAVSVATGTLFGLAPALRLSRPDLEGDLKTARRVVGTRRRGGAAFSRLLVVSQVAVSLTLLIGAALFVGTFRNLMSVNAGFEREQVVSARFDARLAGFAEENLPALYARLVDHAASIPGVRGSALAVSGTVTGSSRTSSFAIQGRPVSVSDDEARVDYVGPGFFTTLGIGLVRGRLFTEHDDARTRRVAVVNEAMVRHFFRNEDPIGCRIGSSADEAEVEVVGVVRDSRVDGPRGVVPPMIYYPLAQGPGEYARNLYVRVTGSPAKARAELKRAVAAAESNLAVREVATLAELNERTVSRERFVSDLIGLFGLLAVAVACLGLYGTISYSVARRTNEIGVRLALGASAPAVRWMVLRETFGLLGAGVAVGLAFAVVSLRAVGSLLYGLSPNDPATLAGATLLVVSVGLFAGAIPAWRASRIDPMTALRIE
ncbi:MAG: ADOP family duplicated permease, partial [Bacteroidales bacterium]